MHGNPSQRKWLSPHSRSKCALTIDNSGEKDEQTSCFKPGRPFAEGYKILKEHMMIFSGQQDTDNPFEITEPDVEDALFAGNMISNGE